MASGQWRTGKQATTGRWLFRQSHTHHANENVIEKKKIMRLKSYLPNVFSGIALILLNSDCWSNLESRRDR
jgi:hypothetical protein